MNEINAEWHKAHKMPIRPTDEERAKWHIEHAKHCACRQPTPAIQKLIDDYKAKQMEDQHDTEGEA